MASYNTEKYIETAIKSVLSQTYSNWELIVVDDCSPDQSNLIIMKYIKDNRIKLVKHSENLGYGGALKTGAMYASKEILGILDTDDKLHDNALKIMNVAYNMYPDCGFIYSTMWKCNSNLKNCKIEKLIGPIIPEKSFIFNPIISHFKTFKKIEYQKTSGFEIKQRKCVDKDIIYKLEEVTNFKYINKPLYYYRQHEIGISQGKNIERIYRYITKYKTYLRRINSNIPNFTKKEMIFEYFYCKYYNKLIFTIKIIIFLKISELIKKLFRKFPIKSFKRKIFEFKYKYIDLF